MPADMTHMVTINADNKVLTMAIAFEPKTAAIKPMTPTTNRTAAIDIWSIMAISIIIEPLVTDDKSVDSILPKLALMGI